MSMKQYEQEVKEKLKDCEDVALKVKDETFRQYLNRLAEYGFFIGDEPYADVLTEVLQEMYFYHKYLDLFCRVEAGEATFPLIDSWELKFHEEPQDNIIYFPKNGVKHVKL